MLERMCRGLAGSSLLLEDRRSSGKWPLIDEGEVRVDQTF